jgi:hypothetical protein
MWIGLVVGPVLFVVAIVAVAMGHEAEVWRAALGLAALEAMGFAAYVVLSALMEKELRPLPEGERDLPSRMDSTRNKPDGLPLQHRRGDTIRNKRAS